MLDLRLPLIPAPPLRALTIPGGPPPLWLARRATPARWAPPNPRLMRALTRRHGLCNPMPPKIRIYTDVSMPDLALGFIPIWK